MKRKHLLHCNIAGFTYYEGPIVFNRLQIGTELRLVVEPENQYDHDAIALYFEEHKLGFIPRTENKTLSVFLKQGYDDLFEVFINRVSPNEYPENQIGVIVYLKKKNLQN
jgi:hypothetical protein